MPKPHYKLRTDGTLWEWNQKRWNRAGEIEDGVAVDLYGNPMDGNSLPYCPFPNCGCDGARNCMAEHGANIVSMILNKGH